MRRDKNYNFIYPKVSECYSWLILRIKNWSTLRWVLWSCKRLPTPDIHDFINHYRQGHLIDLPPYHDCNRVNKNGSRKMIQYQMGEQCVVPTEKRYCRKPKAKYRRKIGVLYWTRHIWPIPGLDTYSKTKVILFIILSLRSMNIWIKHRCITS